MYHQVMVPEEDVDLLRFLCSPNGDLYLQNVNAHVLWCSVANFALRQCAEDKGLFHQLTLHKICYCF